MAGALLLAPLSLISMSESLSDSSMLSTSGSSQATHSAAILVVDDVALVEW